MLRYFLFLLLVGGFVGLPESVNAAGIFNDSASFVLAKAVKLGRSSAAAASAYSDYNNPGSIGGSESNICYVGSYNAGKDGCKSCADAITGCQECESKTKCTLCQTGYELVGTTCQKAVCSWNHNGSELVASNCPNGKVDGYGQSATITVSNTHPKYQPPSYQDVNIRFWDNANVSGTFTTSVLKSVSHTSSQLALLKADITFNDPVTVTDTVILQEDSSDAASGVTMYFKGGLKGNPKCVVKKHKATTNCGYASCSEEVETNNTCTCTTSKCFIGTAETTCKNASERYFWNANGQKNVPSGYKCIDGYGANADIIMPSGASFNTVNIRFWQYAAVSGSFSTNELSSLYHTSSALSDLDTEIQFNDPVTVSDTVKLAEASGSTTGNRKGIKMVFNGGLKGSPSCVVVKQKSSSGCGYASCQANVDTDAVCACSSSECVIMDPIANCVTYDTTSKACAVCETGYMLLNGKCTNASCDAGYYLSDSNSCVACASGTYSKGGTATSCSSCSTLYTSAGSNTCTSCTTTGTCLGSNSGSGSGSNTSCSSGQSYGTHSYGCNSSLTYTGCAYSDFGKSCTSASQCQSGLCASCVLEGVSNPQGSSCR